MTKHSGINGFLLGVLFCVILGTIQLLHMAHAQLYNPAVNTTVYQGIAHFGYQTGLAANVGTLALGSKTVTLTGITGIKAGDICIASWDAAQSITAGLDMAGCRASANGQVDVVFSTPLLAGLSLGAVNINIGWMGP